MFIPEEQDPPSKPCSRSVTTAAPGEGRSHDDLTSAVSELDLKSFVRDADAVALDGLLSWPSQQRAGRDVEPAPVAGTGHGRALQLTRRERALEVGTRIAEGVERSAHVRHRDSLSADL